ncbi:MAG TPA: histidinol-phosphate transaminase, partial [Alphaproteobacteria bacterium]|nr:histidinol-phosphate transaminase [Alphaproteobacteria bacterium]
MKPAWRVRPGILGIDPYEGGKSKIAGTRNPIKLSSNEGALGPSPKAVAAFREAGRQLDRYPDGGAFGLREAIGKRFGLDPGRIVCGAGSDELLGLAGRAFAGPGDEVIYTDHGFLIYPIIARSVGATPVKAPEKRLTASVDEILGRVSARTKIVYLANPNNPTGTYLSASEMRRLRKGLPRHVILVVDAAYAEFVTARDYEPGIALVDAARRSGADNVIMTRTFSKVFGLGGLRLGWAYAPASVADLFNRLRMPFNISAPAQAAGVAALADRAHTRRAVAHNARWREWLTQRLIDAGLTVHPSVANFVTVEFPARGAHAMAAADAYLNRR